MGTGARDQHVDVLVITPVGAIEISMITAFASMQGILTFTLDKELLDQGVALGMGLEENRPRFKINLTTAKVVDADFSSQLLELSDVVK